MIIFDQLRISDDGKRFYINAHVNTSSYFNNMVIEKITIMTSDKVSETNPNIPSEEYVYTKTFYNNEKEIGLVLTIDDMIELNNGDFSKKLFFVYIKCKGIVASCTPCRLDEEVTLGVTFDETMLYHKVMSYTKQLANTCEIPNEYIDFILQWNAFKASIETEHYIPAIKYFNMLFDNIEKPMKKICGCNG